MDMVCGGIAGRLVSEGHGPKGIPCGPFGRSGWDSRPSPL